jgi:hypothetical protein
MLGIPVEVAKIREDYLRDPLESGAEGVESRRFDDVFEECQQKGQSLLVLGASGLGKSWLAYRLTWRLLVRLEEDPAGLLPLLVNCVDLGNRLIQVRGADLLKAVSQLVRERLNQSKLDAAEGLNMLIERYSAENRVLIIIDAWDEQSLPDPDVTP